MDKRLQDLLKKGEELEQNRKELADNLKAFVPSSGGALSVDWINEKILGLKSPIRKRKIKRIFSQLY
jgi:hypothetical protein